MPAHSHSDINVVRVTWIAATLTIACVLIFLQKTFLSMVDQWENSASYNYYYLIPPAALFLIWMRREIIHGIMPRATVSGIAALIAAASVWIVGHLTRINFI